MEEFNKELVNLMNAALADEWIAYYQYWISYQLVYGVNAPNAKDEFLEHAQEEYEHANMLAFRITQLNGVPVLYPTQFNDIANNKVKTLGEFSSKSLLTDNLNSENDAVEVYKKMLTYIGDKDPVTEDIIRGILADEEEHVKDLSNLIKDIS